MEGNSSEIKLKELCAFCQERFSTEKDLSNHLDGCNISIKNIIRIEARQCVLCKRKMPSFSLCGLISHAIICFNERQSPSSPNPENLPENLQDGELVCINANSDVDCPNPKNNVEGQTTQIDETTSPNVALPLSPHRPICTKVGKSPVKPTMAADQANNINVLEFDWRQKAALKNFFRVNPTPTPVEQSDLAKETGLLLSQIADWFAREKDLAHLPMVSKYVEIDSSDEDDYQDNWEWVDVKVEMKQNLEESSPRKGINLKDFFDVNPNPGPNEINYLIEETGLTQEQIKEWFTCQQFMLEHKRYMLEKVLQERLQKKAVLEQNLDNQEGSGIPNKRKPMLTAKGRQILNNHFQLNRYPCGIQVLDIGKETGLEKRQVQNWFINKRKRLGSKNTRRKKWTDKPTSAKKVFPTNSAPMQGSGQSTRKKRQRLTEHQALTLTASFTRNRNPDAEMKRMLANKTKLTLTQIINWFNNRRRAYGIRPPENAEVIPQPQISKAKVNDNPALEIRKQTAKRTKLTFKQISNWYYKKFTGSISDVSSPSPIN